MTVTTPPLKSIKALVDLLAELGVDPLHLHADGRTPLDTRPNLRLWLRHRTDYERVINALRLKSVERPNRMHGQREWFAERDDDGVRLLVSCVSFEHHDDWEPLP